MKFDVDNNEKYMCREPLSFYMQCCNVEIEFFAYLCKYKFAEVDF